MPIANEKASTPPDAAAPPPWTRAAPVREALGRERRVLGDGRAAAVVVGRAAAASSVGRRGYDRPVRDVEALLAAAVVGAARDRQRSRRRCRSRCRRCAATRARRGSRPSPPQHVLARVDLEALVRLVVERDRGQPAVAAAGRSSRRSCPSRTRSRPATPAAPGRRARSCRCRTSARPRSRCRGRSRRRRFGACPRSPCRSPRSTGTGMCPRMHALAEWSSATVVHPPCEPCARQQQSSVVSCDAAMGGGRHVLAGARGRRALSGRRRDGSRSFAPTRAAHTHPAAARLDGPRRAVEALVDPAVVGAAQEVAGAVAVGVAVTVPNLQKAGASVVAARAALIHGVRARRERREQSHRRSYMAGSHRRSRCSSNCRAGCGVESSAFCEVATT